MTKLKLMLALAALALPGMAAAERIPTYVAIATWTAGGTGTNAFAFQNTSSDRTIRILKIDILPVSGGTVTSGPMNFWVLGSTQMTHGGTSQVSAASLNSANWSKPSYVSASTGPVSVQFEGNDTRQLPLLLLGANPDETASPVMGLNVNGLDAPADEQGIDLPRGTNRGIIIRQRQFGATDYTAGDLLARIVYTIR